MLIQVSMADCDLEVSLSPKMWIYIFIFVADSVIDCLIGSVQERN